jgi:tRNA pseudouridine32 synthase/23S rRNA pseudouridine746 synthase
MNGPTTIHVDTECIVVVKPSGLLAVPGRGEAGRDCLAAQVQARWADGLVVHRLDMATSGLILFARGAAAQRELSRAFAERRVQKAYVAIVAGEMRGEHGEIDLPLAADWPNRPKQKVDGIAGKPSLTRWRVLGRGDGVTRVGLEPVTGRAHQLRVHLLAVGHPILGDALYAPADLQPAAHRLMLHATRLCFAQPASGATLDLGSDPPF